jgi:hypothetical protein
VIDNKSGVIKADNNITIHAKTLNNTAYHYDTKQDDSDGYYGYDVNEKVASSVVPKLCFVCVMSSATITPLIPTTSFP